LEGFDLTATLPRRNGDCAGCVTTLGSARIAPGSRASTEDKTLTTQRSEHQDWFLNPELDVCSECAQKTVTPAADTGVRVCLGCGDEWIWSIGSRHERWLSTGPAAEARRDSGSSAPVDRLPDGPLAPLD
jgi:hypothetical protein